MLCRPPQAVQVREDREARRLHTRKLRLAKQREFRDWRANHPTNFRYQVNLRGDCAVIK